MTTAPTAQHDAITALEDAGLRITGQRRQVVAAVERRDGGFTAEDISGQLPGVGRATVFRTL